MRPCPDHLCSITRKRSALEAAWLPGGGGGVWVDVFGVGGEVGVGVGGGTRGVMGYNIVQSCLILGNLGRHELEIIVFGPNC